MWETVFINYRTLVQRVEEKLGEIRSGVGDSMACRKGCDGCCRHISIFMVEACWLVLALEALTGPERSRIRERARHADPEGCCPLLEEGCCVLYAARPLICRTHGYPILVEEGGDAFLDCCPLNFTDNLAEMLPFSLSLDSLNRMLSAVHTLFMKESPMVDRAVPDRMSIAEALLMDWESWTCGSMQR
ncbi:YkgJ family cysteine cluster protein [Desulfobotulus sp. H1]|uniref:YkgJ family cysteine cluster protein n=1 Tax=Desulfobotulus pelophilus TaxID=2823377 RepID=A0ABT3N7Y0_9BACT|nr:YkgJ family cysteine cluster protein [Desulfobotulus pelophilus]MCW7753561.1 YkgJ family cysteine cluster protein [Desulfobotulus pelophilus]